MTDSSDQSDACNPPAVSVQDVQATEAATAELKTEGEPGRRMTVVTKQVIPLTS